MTSIHDNNLRHWGTKGGARTQDQPHSVFIPLVEVLSRIAATREREGQMILVPGIPGTSASKFYMCLADSSSPPGYAWLELSSTTTGAPVDATYLVGTAHSQLSSEIVVGTTPGGELGNTWASPTVDTTHSGSSHAGVIATHEADATPHTSATWLTIRIAAGVPAGAPTGTEIPVAIDTTAVTGGVYGWDGANWIKGSSI